MPGGKEQRVTETNKKEYVDLYVEWRLKNGTEQQTGALQKGFYEVVPKHLLSGEDLVAFEELTSEPLFFCRNSYESYNLLLNLKYTYLT